MAKDRWVELAMSLYREHVAQALAIPRIFGPEEKPEVRALDVLGSWGMRYQARRHAIEGLPRKTEQALRDALEQRYRARDEAVVGRVPWPTTLGHAVSNMNLWRFSGVDRDEPHPHGPSVRALWLSADGDLERVLEVIDAWALAPVPSPRSPLPKRWERAAIDWEATGDPDLPWRADADGTELAVRLDDFPEVEPWTLLVDGEEEGHFCEWPKAWQRGPRPVSPTYVVPKAASRWADRYRAGEHEAVWSELADAGPEIDRYEAVAREVATETMRRVRRNVELLVPRLRALGVRFGNPGWSPEPLTPPDPADRKLLAKLARTRFRIPLALEAFALEVGIVDLRGHHPVLCPGGSRAPWMVAPPAASWGDAFEDLRELWKEEREPIELVLCSSSDLTEAWVQGEDPLLDSGVAVFLPDPVADPVLHGAEGRFVPWLRTALRFGGYPGWAGEPPPVELKTLTEGFAPF